MQKYKIIFFDIDGTLYSHKQNCIPKSTIDSIKRLRENGYKIALCSGRSLYLLNQLKILNYIEVDYMILINGTLVIDKHNNSIIYKKPFNKITLDKLIKRTRELNGELGILTSNDLFRLDSKTDLIIKGYAPLHIPVPVKKDYRNKEVYQCNLFIDDEKLYLFNDLSPELDFIHLLDYGYDVLVKGENKVKGIKKLLDYLNISQENTIAFGDGNNDVGMIEYVGLGIAMGNSVDLLKKSANYITESIDKDGIYLALKNFNLI